MATTTVDLGPVIGPQGPAGEVDPTTPIPFATPAADADMASGDRIDTLFGKIKKRFAVILDKIGDLTTLTTTAKSNTVSAINEINNNFIGRRGALTTGTQITDLLPGIYTAGSSRPAWFPYAWCVVVILVPGSLNGSFAVSYASGTGGIYYYDAGATTYKLLTSTS